MSQERLWNYMIFADAIGFEIIALGKGKKNNPLDHTANPASAEAEAKAKRS
ncbi:hypothetical protein GCM10020331_013220 [Ectobacillus funiculus]